MTTRPQRSGPLHRIPGMDFSVSEEILKAAALLIVPEDQTQRQAFEKLMPYLYLLKNKGCSFPQIAHLLTQCGFNLKPSSVRIYYNKMLATHMDICQERMNEQILLMAEVRKETKGADMSAIFERVSAIMDKQQLAAGSKIDLMLGIGTKHNTGTAPGSGSDEFAGPATGNANVNAGQPVFFSMGDDAPNIPDLTARLGASENMRPAAPSHDEPQLQSRLVSCRPVPSGVKFVQRKMNVPAAVYEPGDMEHPSVPGIMLSLDQRLCSVALEFVDEDGEIRLETSEEKRLRVFWFKPVTVMPTMTSGSFTKMDESLFAKKSG